MGSVARTYFETVKLMDMFPVSGLTTVNALYSKKLEALRIGQEDIDVVALAMIKLRHRHPHRRRTTMNCSD